MSRIKSQTSNPPSRCQTFRTPDRRVMIPCSPGCSLDVAITLYLGPLHARVSIFSRRCSSRLTGSMCQAPTRRSIQGLKL